MASVLKGERWHRASAGRTELCAEAAALSRASCSASLPSSEGIAAGTEGIGGTGGDEMPDQRLASRQKRGSVSLAEGSNVSCRFGRLTCEAGLLKRGRRSRAREWHVRTQEGRNLLPRQASKKEDKTSLALLV